VLFRVRLATECVAFRNTSRGDGPNYLGLRPVSGNNSRWFAICLDFAALSAANPMRFAKTGARGRKSLPASLPHCPIATTNPATKPQPGGADSEQA
jgi:hypothetical protein